MSRVEEVQVALAEYGLKIRGGFAPQNTDKVPTIKAYSGSATLVLVGNIGSSIWQNFRDSQEFSDGKTHPLDRWSKRIGQQLASDFNGLALYPFDGPPYWPFLTWTQRAEGLNPSPLGLNFHPEYGLWHAYRFALLLPFTFDEKVGIPRQVDLVFNCNNCSGQPCLHSCPVSAFDGKNYDTNSCANYLNNNLHASCNSHGCRARHACPVGQRFAYEPEQASFHMQAFLTARTRLDQ